MRALQAGDVSYKEQSAATAARARVELDGVSAEKSVAAARVSDIYAVINGKMLDRQPWCIMQHGNGMSRFLHNAQLVASIVAYEWGTFSVKGYIILSQTSIGRSRSYAARFAILSLPIRHKSGQQCMQCEYNCSRTTMRLASD